MNKWSKNHINFWLAYNDDDVAAVEEISWRMRIVNSMHVTLDDDDDGMR
jgi:hypothetical protein